MSPVSVSRSLFIALSLITLGVMIWALGPFADHKDSGGQLVSLLLSPFLAIWAVGPYAVAHRFASEGEGAGVWAYPALHIVSGATAMFFYANELFIAPAPDLNAPWVFATIPVYQFIAVVVIYYGLRVVRRGDADNSEA
jgi:hypothetical protein